MRLAQAKASGAVTRAAGMRKGRTGSGSERRRAARLSGVAAYIRIVAVVQTLTSFDQLGKGNRKRIPTVVVTAIATHGTLAR